MFLQKRVLLIIGLIFCCVFRGSGQVVSLSTPIPVPANSVCPADTSILLYEFTLAQTGTVTVTGISFTPAGSAVPAGIAHYELWSGDSFATATPLVSSPGTTFNYSVIPTAAGTNFWITATPAALVTPGKISVGMTPADIAVAGTHTITGTPAPGDTQTIILPPTVSGITASPAVCAGDFIVLSAGISTGSGPVLSYTWTGPGLYINSTVGNTDTLVAGSVAASGSYSVRVTYPGPGCTSQQAASGPVTVTDTPSLIISTLSQSLCSGSLSTAVNFSGTGNSPVYHWSYNPPPVGINPSDSGSIAPFVVRNNTPGALIAVFTVTASSANCFSSQGHFTITVLPVPTLTATLSNPAICNNSTETITISSTADSTRYTFTSGIPVGMLPRDSTLTGSFGAPSFTASDTLSDSVHTQIVIYDTAYGCAGVPDTEAVTIYPTPSIHFIHDGVILLNDTVCANTHNDQVVFTNSSQGSTSYLWTSSDTSVFRPVFPGFYYSGNYPIFPGFQSVNDSTYEKVDSVVIIGTANGCHDTAHFSIVVNPVPHINNLTDSVLIYSNDTIMPVVNFFLHDSLGISTGFAWYNEDSSGTNIGKTALTTGTNILPGSTDSTNNPNASILPNTFVVTPYTHIVSTDSTCYGASTNITIEVKPIAALSSAHDTTVCDSTALYYIPTSETPGATFFWVRALQTGISNAADSNAGNISETLVNTTNSAVTVKYFFTINSPTGGVNHDTLKVTVSPRPKLNALSPRAFCSDVPYNITLTSPTSGSLTYFWQLDTAGLLNIQKPGGGWLYADSALNGEISDTLVNTSYDSVHVSYAITLTLSNGCSASVTDSVTIHPAPAVAALTPPSFNNDTRDSFSVHLLTVDPVSYRWQRQYAAGITGVLPLTEDAGTAARVTDSLINSSNDSVEVAYVFTLTMTSYPGCTSYPVDSIFIHPKPGITMPAALTVCGDSLISYTVHSPTEGIVTYSWYRDTAIAGTTTISGNNTGTDSIVYEYLKDTTDHSVTVKYYFKVFANTDSSVDTVSVTVNPTPRLNNYTSPSFCNNTQDSIILSVPTSGIINTAWTRALTPGIANAPAYGTGSDTTRILEVLDDTTNFIIPVSYTLVLYATNGSLQCKSASIAVTDSIKPTPVINAVTPANCNDSAVLFSVVSPTYGAHTFTWYLDTVTTGGYLTPSPLHGHNTSAGTTDSTVSGVALVNLKDSIIHAPYYFTIGANGCYNTVQVIDSVRPTPIFSDSVDIFREICSGVPIVISVGSPTQGGVTYSWSLNTVSGITAAGITTGTGSLINDTLNNIDSARQLTVIYVFTLTADGCPNDTPKITYNIDPIPHLNSIKAFRICGDSLLYYTATSSVTDITNTYAWKSPNTTAYDFLPNFGSGNIISGDRINKVYGAGTPVDSVQVNIVNFTITERGCTSDTTSTSNNVYITIEPRPLQPVISTFPASATLCQGSDFLNFGDSAADRSVTYLWECMVGNTPHPEFVYQVDSQNTTNVYAVLKFDSTGTYSIILKAYISPVTDTLSTCFTTDTLTYTVGYAQDTSNDTARVVYQNNMLICLKNNFYNVTHYQWGYDNNNISPTLIDSVVNGDSLGNQQNYYVPFLDTANKHWWVETWEGNQSCIQKSYYNPPPGDAAFFGRSVSPPNNQLPTDIAMKVYPNPARNSINVELTDNILTGISYYVYDITGRKVMEVPGNAGSNVTTLPVTDLSAGYYFIACIQQGKRIGITKFVKD